MANIRIKPALERIGAELSRVREQIRYSGVSEKDARIIDNMATQLAVEATEIAAEARLVAAGNYGGKPLGLVRQVRKALGFTYP